MEISFKIKNKKHGEELNTSFDLINIRLKIRSKIFSGSGDLKIKCTAAIDPIYWRSSEESIQVIMVIIINNWDNGDNLLAVHMIMIIASNHPDYDKT